MSNKNGINRFLATITETFGLGRGVALTAIFMVGMALAFGVFWFFHSAPPATIIMTTGPEGSIFQATAEKYRANLARHRVNLQILPSKGSLENLQRLEDDAGNKVDVGFVQGGITNGIKGEHLVSLGSVSYEPLLIFYRSATPMELLSDLAGKRLAIGAPGSGTRSLALALLEVNGILPGGPTPLLDLDANEGAEALTNGQVDAVFLMADSASSQLLRKLLRTPEIRLFSFAQADGYMRRIHYLNKLVLPRGVIDFGKDLPEHDIYLVGPTVEIVARADLHPALSDLLLEAAREVHGRATLFQRRGEFPAPIQQDFHISTDAARYYKSGKSFLYRYLPFWLASQVNRVLLVFIPLVVILVPALRSIPTLYRWRIRLRIYRRYRALLVLEDDVFRHPTPQKRETLLARLDEIEKSVNRMKVPASFADQFYALRGYINFVRNQLTTRPPP